jgi:hypothetical protein
MGIGFSGCGIAVTLEAGLTAKYLNTENKSGLGAAVFAFFLYVVCFELCLDGPVSFYHSEIWPTHMRAKGYTVAFTCYSATNIIWLQAAPTAFDNIGWKFYIFFIFFAAFGALSAFFVFPDTLHKPLEEVATMFGDQDLVVVHQNEPDKGQIALEVIEQIIPGIDTKRPSRAESSDKGESCQAAVSQHEHAISYV